jgi:deoxyhypusine synthase
MTWCVPTLASVSTQLNTSQRSWRDPETGDKTTIFLGYTSNLISSGLRGTFRWLAEHNHISAIVTTAGGIEEDFIKCLGDTYMGSFSTSGAELRAKGMNRIGNLIVPNDNYCKFEDWVVPILDKMLEEQEASKGKGEDEIYWTPSKIGVLLVLQKQHPRFLSCVHRWLVGRHAVFPYFQIVTVATEN